MCCGTFAGGGGASCLAGGGTRFGAFAGGATRTGSFGGGGTPGGNGGKGKSAAGRCAPGIRFAFGGGDLGGVRGSFRRHGALARSSVLTKIALRRRRLRLLRRSRPSPHPILLSLPADGQRAGVVAKLP